MRESRPVAPSSRTPDDSLSESTLSPLLPRSAMLVWLLPRADLSWRTRRPPTPERAEDENHGTRANFVVSSERCRRDDEATGDIALASKRSGGADDLVVPVRLQRLDKESATIRTPWFDRAQARSKEEGESER
jgi:hypothetical protein